jgi:YHS domain-containing protein
MAIAIDPVCGMEVDTTTSQLKTEHNGETYWFCGKGCLLEFQDDPDKYLDPGYEKSMEPGASGRRCSGLTAGRRAAAEGGWRAAEEPPQRPTPVAAPPLIRWAI